MPVWLDIILRSIGLFVLLILLMRLVGRKMAARMTYFDTAFAMTLGAIAAAISLHIVDNLVYGLIALLSWGLAGIALGFLSQRSRWVRNAVHGREAVVIKHGKILEDQLKRVRYTPEDLLQQLRSKQIFNVADVEFAVLEANGEVNALLKSNRQPINPKHLGVETAPETGVQTVMLDGNIIDEHLTAMGLNRRWLRTELEKIGVSPENVFLAQVDASGELYIDLFDDAIQIPKPTTRQLLLTTLQKAKADLESYALDTEDQRAQQDYKQSAKELATIIDDVKPLLK